MPSTIIELSNLVAGEIAIFSPESYSEDNEGIVINCSVGNRYRVPKRMTKFIDSFKSIFEENNGTRYSLCCTLDENGKLDCYVM